jgi:L-fuconolactonase
MIDSHHHFWNYTAAEFGWVTNEMAILRRDFLPENLEKAVVGTGINGAISVQARRSVEETNWLLGLATGNPLIKGVVGWAPLKDASVGGLLDRLVEDPLFCGVREILQGAADEEYFDCPDFNRGMRELTLRGIPYDLLIFHHQLGRAAQFVDAHPAQRFILDHIAKPEIRKAWSGDWARALRELARRPNVFCKFSGVVTEVREPSWDAAFIRPYFETALEAFGAARLMFGSDWPVCLLRTGYSRWVSAVQELAAPLSANEREEFFGGTARTAYALASRRLRSVS